MKVISELKETNSFIRQLRAGGKTVGFVPTMGALHQGHISLIEASKKENDYTVCSIYVNPTQFNNKEDFETYPNLFAQDKAKLEEAGCDVIFAPSHDSMYPNGVDNLLTFDFGALTSELEGRYIPGHFSGVGIVVSKLLNVVMPDVAYFGQKDLQQFMVIRKLVSDLSIMTEVKSCPTLRETDGLAMSSRNLRLNKEERNIAPLLYSVLKEAKSALIEGQDVGDVQKKAFDTIAANPLFTPEYIEIVDFNSFSLISKGKINNSVAICLSAHLGKARLIDNVIVEV